MLGLATAWLLTYFMVCAFNGQISAVESAQADVPSKVFALGGVFGVSRPLLEIIWRTTASGLFGLAALIVCDLVYARRTMARWFALHVIANVWISILCLPDLWHVCTNPIEALTQTSVNHWPTSLVFSVHVYHMLFFRNLQVAPPTHSARTACFASVASASSAADEAIESHPSTSPVFYRHPLICARAAPVLSPPLSVD